MIKAFLERESRYSYFKILKMSLPFVLAIKHPWIYPKIMNGAKV